MRYGRGLAGALFLAANLLSACGTPPQPIEVNTNATELSNVQRVSVASSAGKIDISGASGVGLITLFASLPLIGIGSLAVGSIASSIDYAVREGRMGRILPASWIEQQMTEAFARAAGEANLFEIVPEHPAADSPQAQPNAIVKLSLDKIDIIPAPESQTLLLTGTASLTSISGSLLWQTATTVRGQALTNQQANDPETLRQEFQMLLGKLSTRFANDLAYARQ